MNKGVNNALSNRDTNVVNDNGSIYNGDVTNNNYYYPKLKTDKSVKEEANGSSRPYLADKYGKKVKVIGLCICQYRHYFNRYTIINVMDYSGNYVADHIQIDIPEEFIIDVATMLYKQVVVIGEVTDYESNCKPNGKDYKITLYDIYALDSACICYDEPKQYNCPLSIISDEVSLKSSNEVYALLEVFKRKLNFLTGCFGQNYVFNYIVSQYMLNTCSIDLYKSGPNISKLNDKILVDLLILASSALFNIWKKDQEILLYDIMKRISEEVSIIQGVRSYDSDINITEFCNNKLGLGGRKAKKLAHEVYTRKLDFGELDPEITLNNICHRALIVINTELKITEDDM